MHSPADVRISVCAAAERMRYWEWVKWLPHNMHPTERDAAGAVRLMTPSLGWLEPMLQLHDRPRFTPGSARPAPGSLPLHVVLVDGAARDPGTDAGGVDGVVVIDLSAADAPGAAAPGPTTLALRVTPDEVYRLPPDGTAEALIGVPDALSHLEAEALARQLAPLRPATAGAPAEDALALNTTLTSLLGIDSLLTLDVAALRRARAPRDRLRVPIGHDAGGQPVELDIKESAQGGMGPHGLVVGATGSGKSELLRTLVLGLAITHSAEDLNFVLVDFKGGATFLGLDRLPHVSAVITNLADELPLVDRMRDALAGEVVRRQELLRAAGNYASLRDYTRARAEGARAEGARRPGRTGRRCRRCRACSWCSTSSPSCWRPSRSSSTCSSRSGGSAARSACTCCSPPSGWRRAACAGWTPSCPTGSACARSPRRSRGPCSAARTPTSCRPSRETPT